MKPERSENDAIVYLVDDDSSFRKSTARLLDYSGYRVRDFGSVGEFLVGFDKYSSGCLILDIAMPDTDGLELFDYLRKEGVGLPVVFLSGHGTISTAVETVKDGAFDFLTKPVEKDRLLEVIVKALDFDAKNVGRNMRRRELRASYASLTPMEKKILQLIVEGAPNKAIAEELGNAERTVKLHRANLSTKVGASCTADLVRFYFEAELG